MGLPSTTDNSWNPYQRPMPQLLLYFNISPNGAGISTVKLLYTKFKGALLHAPQQLNMDNLNHPSFSSFCFFFNKEETTFYTLFASFKQAASNKGITKVIWDTTAYYNQ